jgi:hypothetical protein
MALTGFRLIVIICLFVSTALYVTARQQTGLEQARPLVAATAELEQARPSVAATPELEQTRPLVAATAALEGPRQEVPRQLEPVPVDPVREPGADVPLDRDLRGPKDVPRLMQRLDGDDVVAVTVNEEDWGTGDDVTPKVLGSRHKPRKAHNARHRPRAAKAHVKRHHRALAKAHKRKRIVGKAKRGKLVVQKRIKSRRRMVHAAPALSRVAKRKLKPLASAKRVAGAGLRRVR